MKVEIPAIRPDELLYSVIARGQNRIAASTNLFSSRVFGSRKVIRPLFDHSFNWIAKCMSKATGWSFSPEQLLEENTLFRAGIPSIPIHDALSLRESLLGNEEGTSTIRLHKAICTPPNFTLRYCPSCRNDDLVCFGEPYWHRSHQIPGLRICFRHLEPLVKTSARADPGEYVTASRAHDVEIERVPRSARTLQTSLGRDLTWLLENNSEMVDRTRLAAVCAELAERKQLR